MSASLLRRITAVLAMVAGIGLATAAAESASASATPVSSASTGVSATHAPVMMAADWWW